jgi:hypothetical protein
MPKRAFYALCFAAFAVCLVPHRSSVVDALQANLWTTSRGGWGSPVAPGQEMEIVDWNRTQYGIKWAWLVMDRQADGEAWSARVEPRALLAYGALPVAVLAGAYLLERRRKHLISR